MSTPDSGTAADEKSSIFPATRWSLVAKVQGQPGVDAERALADLCQAYWYPLYAFARSRGLNPHDSEDSTQAFLQQLLSRGAFESVDSERGKLRAFLLASMKNFLFSQWRNESALKRGGDTPILSIDQDWAEGNLAKEADRSTEEPELSFDRHWAYALLQRVSKQLADHYDKVGKRELYEAIKGCLEGDGTYEPGAELAEKLGMNPDAIRAAVYKLRKRFREHVQSEVNDTCTTEEEAREEIVYLCRILAQ